MAKHCFTNNKKYEYMCSTKKLVFTAKIDTSKIDTLLVFMAKPRRRKFRHFLFPHMLNCSNE